MRINTRGQVTIPAAIRKQAGLLPNTAVTVILEGETVMLWRADRGQAILERLRGSGDVKMTTDEIMPLTRGD